MTGVFSSAMASLPESILDRLADGVLEVDAAWQIRYANQCAGRLLERTELLGRSLWDVIPEDSALAAACRKRSNSEVVFGSFEARIGAMDEGLVLILRDISETRALLDAVMKFSTSLIYAKDPEGRFTLVNRKLEELLGFAPGSLVGKSDHDIFPREIADPFRENDRRVLRERAPLTAEEQILVDGQLRTNLSVKFPLERSDGTVFGTAGVSTDITERVRHQQETTLLAEVGLKISETLDWDATLSAIVDVVAKQFAESCVLDIVGEDGVMHRQASASHQGDPKDTLAVPLVARGRTIGRLEIISTRRRFDDRDRETAEELGRLCGLALDNRRATEQLRQEGSLRELFMAVLAHDLRNPLNAIQVGASALAWRRDQPDATSRVAQRMLSSAQRMGKLIEQVLDLTRARAMGGIPVERRPTALAPLVEAVVDEVRAAHPARVIEVVVRGDCKGNWDPDRLAQAVSNLVGNAVTHGTPGTPVRVELAGDAREVELTIHNESAPIPRETLATLFDPFRRGSKPGAPGLGLGLYITDQIVRSHGGTIAAESDASGTRFRVTLPCG
jgi:PAS domain S-box-containing protein